MSCPCYSLSTSSANNGAAIGGHRRRLPLNEVRARRFNEDDENQQCQQQSSEGDHAARPFPVWLQVLLVLLITINVAAHFTITWWTMRSLEEQAAELKAESDYLQTSQRVNVNGTSENKPMEIRLGREDPQETLLALSTRQRQILLGTILEVSLDSLDLLNTFCQSYPLHMAYAAFKLVSIGLWAYTQADMNLPTMWFIPIICAMLITLLLVEWYESSRRWILALLIMLASAAWIYILSVRSSLMKQLVEQWQEERREDRTQLDLQIQLQHTHMTRAIIATSVMVALGLYGLLVISLANIWLGVLFVVLYFAGDLWWIVLITTGDDEHRLEQFFEVPLVYGLLLVTMALLYLYELYYNRQNGANGSSSSLLKRIDLWCTSGRHRGAAMANAEMAATAAAVATTEHWSKSGDITEMTTRL